MSPALFAEILQLIQLGLATFTGVVGVFTNKTAPLPATAAPAITAHLQSVPGLTDAHKAVIASAVSTAASLSTAA